VIVLGRAGKEVSLADRITRLLEWFGMGKWADLVETAETDLLKPFCGLEKSRYDTLCAKADQIIHCASDTRFAERFRQESTDTNVRSLSGIMISQKEQRFLFSLYQHGLYR